MLRSTSVATIRIGFFNCCCCLKELDPLSLAWYHIHGDVVVIELVPNDWLKPLLVSKENNNVR